MVGKPVFFQVFPGAAQIDTSLLTAIQTVNCVWEHSDIHVMCFFLWWTWHSFGGKWTNLSVCKYFRSQLGSKKHEDILMSNVDKGWKNSVIITESLLNRIQMWLIPARDASAELSWEWCYPGSCIQFWRGNWFLLLLYLSQQWLHLFHTCWKELFSAYYRQIMTTLTKLC